jgi:transcription initiation factor IIE alpha subunit
MCAATEPASPLSSLFTGSEAAKVIDFLLSTEQQQTIAEIHAGTRASMNMINKIIDELLDIDAAGIGAKRVQRKSRDENTYYIRNDTDTGKSIRDLWYHLMQVQSKNIS